MALTDKLTAIANAIRDKTGGTEPLTLDAMTEAIAGFGQGGGGGLAYDMGEFIFSADANSSRSVSIPHSLGETPGFVLVWTDDFSNLSAENPSTQQCNLGYLYCKNLFSILQKLTSAATTEGLTINFSLSSGDYRVTAYAPTSAAYCVDTSIIKADSISVPKIGNGFYWRAGVKYKYFVSKAWWEVGGTANAE
jgi:hypothetical protein